MTSLVGKHAVVTGGTRGIGLSIVRLLRERGAIVAVMGRSPPAPSPAVPTHHKYYQCDVSDADHVASVASEIVKELGSVDLLFNCAGVSVDGLLVQMSQAQIRSVLDTNLFGTINCCKSFAKPMMKRKAGSIVNLGSIVGERGAVGQSVYSASKSALIGFTRSLALELAHFNLTVNLISPGFIDTDMTKNLPEARRESLKAKIPLRRFGRAEEVAAAALFLSDAPYITGQSITIDGGLSLGGL